MNAKELSTLANARFDAWTPHAETIRFIIRAHATFMLASAGVVTDEVVEIALHAGGAAIVNAEQEIGDDLEVSRYSMRAALESVAHHLATANCTSATGIPRDSTEFGWVIENGKQQGQGLAYRYINNDAGGVCDWTEDPNKALRFARRNDAEQYAYHDEDAWRIVEHGWHSTNPAPMAATTKHPDDVAVELFADAMKAKLEYSRNKHGRDGWNDKTDCTAERLSNLLRGHVAKGDPVDVANYACFLWNRREPIAPAAIVFDLIAHLHRQREFSERTFGPGVRTKGVLDHIRKELAEIEAKPHDITEWVDVILLALDGAWRSGTDPEVIAFEIAVKQLKNEKRIWPDWRTAAPDKAIEHVRTAQPAAFNLSALLSMAHSPVRNYVIPGLTSSLIGAPSPAGTVRLFQNSRDHQESIAPHSHRFDFQCWVLAGSVRNRLWMRTYWANPHADPYHATTLRYNGDIGDYEKRPCETERWRYTDHVFTAGECYSMKSDEIHSIYFSRGAVVLFFEGPKVTNESIVLEPVVDREVIPTMRVEPWMFRREIGVSE